MFRNKNNNLVHLKNEQGARITKDYEWIIWSDYWGYLTDKDIQFYTICHI